MGYKISSILFTLTLIIAEKGTAFCQSADSVVIHQRPVAQNDSATVIQPYSDTLDVTANDYSPSGDSFCLKSVYGSRLFTKLNCNNVVFQSDSSLFGNDTAWYVICNTDQPDLCDTAMIVVKVVEHYTPFMLNDSRWVVYSLECSCDDCGGYSQVWLFYWTASDTIVNGRSYKNMYSQQYDVNYDCTNNQGSPETSIPYLVGFIRQDTAARQVFFLKPDSINELLLYDFNLTPNDTIYLTPGDTIYYGFGDTSYVSSFDYFESGGTFYREINIDIKDYFIYPNAWIEGFGSTYGPLAPYGVPNVQELLCFSSSGITIYPSYASDSCAYIPLGIENITENKFIIYPNPANDNCTLRLNSNGNLLSASLIDITGREIMPLFKNQSIPEFNFNVSLLSSGLYFVKVSDETGIVAVKKLVKE